MTSVPTVESSPTTRAWQVVSRGDDLDSSVAIRHVRQPVPAAHQVVVDVQAAALGFPDMLLARGLYHDSPELPFSLGGEAAGFVIEAGDECGVTVGDAVIVTPDRVATGLLQERLVVDADRVLPVPGGMPMVEAAAFFSAYQTSYIGLARRCDLARGETLLVLGASGGIGAAAVELGRALGAQVIAVTRGDAKTEFCQSLGAHHVIDGATEDLKAQVDLLTDGRGVDVVFDPVGGTVTDQARRCIAVEGRLLIIGFASGEIPTVPVNHALLKNYSIVGYRTWPFRGDPQYRRQVHATLSDLYERGELRPRVDVVGFDDVVAGLRRIADRQVTGRVVIAVGASR